MSNMPISIILSPAQVDQIVRAAAQDSTSSFSTLITAALQEHWEEGGEPAGGFGYLPAADEDGRLSRSLLRGLSILTCFGPDNRERGIIELAGQLGMSPSTTHRYVSTLVELGLLERLPRTRKYRLARVPLRSDGESAGGDDGAPLAQPGVDD
jgi:hypothetical protein